MRESIEMIKGAPMIHIQQAIVELPSELLVTVLSAGMFELGLRAEGHQGSYQ